MGPAPLAPASARDPRAGGGLTFPAGVDVGVRAALYLNRSGARLSGDPRAARIDPSSFPRPIMALDPQSSARARPRRPGSVIGIAVARFHEELTSAMKDSTVRELVACGVSPDDIHVVWVPGSFELPVAARRLVDVHAPDAVIALGVIVKGETEHDHWVAHGAVSGLTRLSLEENLPVHLGVLTCNTLDQARARALPAGASERARGEQQDGEYQDKGRAVARAAIETLVALDGVVADAAGTDGIGTAGGERAARGEDRL